MKINRRNILGMGLTGLIGSQVLGKDYLLKDEQRAHEDFVDLLLRRRSKRFAKGFKTTSGPLAYESEYAPSPLTDEEEAFLCFCANGITGYAKGDLVYDKKNDGQQMTGFVGRTIPSPDAACTSLLTVTNDRETYALKRPQNLSVEEIKEVISLAKQRKFLDIQKILKVSLKDKRSAPPLDVPYNLAVNKWSLYKPGTSYFLPVTDYSFLHINSLLSAFETHSGAYIVDDRRKFRSAGLAKFGRCRNGGHLYDCFSDFRTFTIEQVEMLTQKTFAVEMGAMIQNLSLGANYLGIGGYPNYAGHEFAWLKEIGFRMETMKSSKYLGLNRFYSFLQKVLKRDIDVPHAVGLEVEGDALMHVFAPPYYANMGEAVDAVLEKKFGPEGVYGSRIQASAFKNKRDFQRQVKNLRPSSKAIKATKAYCQYLFDTYGRFPVHMPAFVSSVGFQASHLDENFYKKYFVGT